MESPTKGWHEFRAPMMRAYCRIMAAKQGIHIGLKYLDFRDKLVEVPLPPSRNRPQ